MNSYVLGFQEIDKTKLAMVGGKGANLGELFKIKGIKVPEGFCVTTEAYKKITENNQRFNHLLDELTRLKAEERATISAISAKIRKVIEETAIPKGISNDVIHHLKQLSEKNTYAVRSSATAEDLPTSSFAGQQDTYLNVIGKEAILKHISKCWASLFTNRAVIYRMQNGFDHGRVYLSVVIQKMIFPQAAGIMFTADPVTGNRKIVSIDASFGLGEALVSGVVNADNYKVRDGKIIDKKIPAKKVAIYALKEGGTKEEEIGSDKQNAQTLMDEQIVELERIGRTIEAHFGRPQDIEWCLADDVFSIVQSRSITTLFPIPEATDQKNHVYVSVGHQQMMTDAMKPLGLSMWQLLAARPMYTAGGRLFVDVAEQLASPAGRNILVNVLGKSDPLMKDIFTTLLERGHVQAQTEEISATPAKGPPLPDYRTLKQYDPAIVHELIERSQTSIDQLKKTIHTKEGVNVVEFILEDIQKLRQFISNPQNFGAIMTAMNAASWINEKMMEWLGEKNLADTLSQSVPHNVTAEMGLALLDIADAIRSYPAVIEYLQQVNDDSFLDGLMGFDGGKHARDVLSDFLRTYGMRCVGEIDITRTRWSEKPTTLLPVILSNIKNFEPGESKRKFEQGREEAMKKEQELIERLKQLPDGKEKAQETKRMIDLVRNLAGYREYPKYAIVSCYFVYKQALMKEAERLVQAHVIQDKQDIYYLTIQELRDAMRTQTADQELINKRKDEFAFYEKITPPRVMTSEGEIVTGSYNRENLPANAIVGLPVSSGVIEGRAHVIFRIEDADLEEGDILVTPFTDPSWTPLFLSIKGLVTEVGGLMTHGAVIAREYGLPAVVGVENATKLIKDGQRIRVHGTEGYVEILI
ncbi:MAG: phosphoenolpyruvate synthase [Candidatus Andersenbacteria bacterium]|nr:phosphoenolpyruvate synthase [Candidatus Andersenbacteria bacterium]MBI3251205.1 phosphoenolpyruvate synthase [Candidatus Andersenbacteria bacterium]